MWLLNVFLFKRTLMQELQKWEPGTKGNLPIMPSCTPWLSWISSSALLFPSTSSSSSLSSLFSSPSSSFSHYFRRFVKPPGPTSSPTGTCRTGTALECLHTGLTSFSPRFQNNDRFEIIYKSLNCERDYKTLFFKCLLS